MLFSYGYGQQRIGDNKKCRRIPGDFDCQNFVPHNGPSTQLINATSCVTMWDATIVAEELANISSYQTLSADKNWKSY